MKLGPKTAVAWMVEDHNADFHYVTHYRDEVSDLVGSLTQNAADWSVKDFRAVVVPLVPHDPKAAGELRRLRAFVKQVAAWNGVAVRKPGEVLEAVTQAAADLIALTRRKGKKR